VKFLKKLPHLEALSDNMRDGMAFNLSAGVGDSGLAFGEPRHQIVTKEDTEAGRGATGVRPGSPPSQHWSRRWASRPGLCLGEGRWRACPSRSAGCA
jgi:hypothetical protein